MAQRRALVLASGSRYRKALLERLGLPFEVFSPELDETALPGEPAADTELAGLLKTIHRYPSVQRPEIVANLERRRGEGRRVVVARNRRDVQALLD